MDRDELKELFMELINTLCDISAEFQQLSENLARQAEGLKKLKKHINTMSE